MTFEVFTGTLVLAYHTRRRLRLWHAILISAQAIAITITHANGHRRALRRHFHRSHPLPLVCMIVSIESRLREIELGQIDKYNIKLN